ncbi:PREDICTED: connectin-like [Vollenhovia emeryi]|uniref:connectin-like n=1 Tax=Vollenhovia emeryi TaxID=411798 RepID=UPI0005F3C1C4|nr:PREDICTED: connectin-like [Vollenhovia emeryi]
MRKFLYNSFILELLLLTILFASSGLAASKTRSRKKLVKVASPVNICDIQGQQSPIFCYCNNVTLNNARNIDCWVLGYFDRDDPMWSHFATSQGHLEKMTFTVRQSGSIDHVPTRLLHEQKNLREFVIQYGKIPELAEHTFSNLNEITQINLHRNSITVLRKYAFENMRNLTVINLDDNHISELDRDTFVNLASLRKLYLNNNNISVIRDKVFYSLGSLQELELSSNELTGISRSAFRGLRSLLRLDLRGNQISTLPNNCFTEMPELTELELDQNKIEFIDTRAFDNMYKLRKLRLSENQLRTLLPNVLTGAPGISFLDLRDNLLKTVTFDNIKPIVTNFYHNNSYLYLGENSLKCNCKLAWIWGLRNETKNMKLRDALEELTCFLESNNATQKIYREDLERNQPRGISIDYSNSRDDNNEDDDGNGNEDDDYYYDHEAEDSPNFRGKNNRNSEQCCSKHLFELKPEDLPCPKREDLMASEQPSSHHENARVGSGSSWFSSSSTSVKAGQSVLVASLLLLAVLFFT